MFRTRAVQAFMSDTTDSRLADVANNSCVNGELYRPWSIYLMIDNDSRRGRTRRSLRSALLLVVGTERPDHGVLEVVHEINRGALYISLCFGGITTVDR